MKQNIVIIGGSYEIGREIVEQLGSSCNLHVLCRTGSGLESLGVNYIPFDVRDEGVALYASVAAVEK
jgi:NAD(P)-dependent dehydrogenase (short-subunit alcohol dehydrogenase family)